MDTPDNTPMNNRLRQERIRRNWRQCDLAEQLGTTVLTVRRWERGSHQPSIYFRPRLCALFGKSPEELGLLDEHSAAASKFREEKEAPVEHTNAQALWTLPYQRNFHFTGREEHLMRLSGKFSAKTIKTSEANYHPELAEALALKGPLGIGKTQIALEYAYRAREQGTYSHIIWINAASEESILADFSSLAELIPAFPGESKGDPTRLIAGIKDWLEQCQQSWLLIFDSADNLALVRPHIPHHGNGNLIFTTRAHAIGSLASSIEVEPMGLLEGTHFLLHRAQRHVISDEEQNLAINIVIALDAYPLALDQAGAYIEETGCDFSDYLHLYQDHRKELLARRGAQSANYPTSVSATWQALLKKVQQTGPATAEFLELCPFFAPDTIPEELIKNNAANWPPLLREATSDSLAFNQIIEDLLTLSLVKRSAESHLLSISRLLQEIQIDLIEPEKQQFWAGQVIQAVNALFPHDARKSSPRCQRYLKQVQFCSMLVQRYNLKLVEAADLLVRAGSYLGEQQEFYNLAEPLFLRALTIYEQQPEPDQQGIICSLSSLAHLLQRQGQYQEAEVFLQRAQAIDQQQSKTRSTALHSEI